MNVVILGSGNTATVLCKVIAKAGHTIVQISSRNEQNAKALADSYSAIFSGLSVPQFADADIYIIALHDVSLDHPEKFPGLKNKLVVHTAGAVSINALKNISENYGVLYPLQTLSKYSSHIPEIPFLVDGSNGRSLNIITGFAKTLSDNVHKANDKERLNYHVAAVFVSNFTNHIYSMAEMFCKQENLDWQTLFPIINETTARAQKISPFESQTGPALRDDIFTLNRHLQVLSSYPDLKYIYLKLSESIIKSHRKS